MITNDSSGYRTLSHENHEDDILFSKLAYFMVQENYHRRAKHQKEEFEEGHENHDLIGLLLLDGCKNDQKHSDDNLYFDNFNSIDDLLEKFVLENHDDGGYSLRDHEISNKTLFKPEEKAKKMFNVDKIAQLFPRYLPDDFTYLNGGIKIGGKTTAGLLMGLTGEGGKSYLIKQTVYDGMKTGKLVRFGEEGVEKEFFLMRTGLNFNDEFYFDDDHEVIGIINSYKFDEDSQRLELLGRNLVKPVDLRRYGEGISDDMPLYSMAEARYVDNREVLGIEKGSFDLKQAS